MDLNPNTMNLTAHTHFHPSIEYGGSAVNFSPQFLTCDLQSAIASNAEYPSFKKPRTSQTPMDSTIPELFNKPSVCIPLCLQFQRGRCTYGDTCQFVHGVGDTQKLLPQMQELMNKERWHEDQKIISTMRLCRRFCNGEQCPYGVRCHFLHEAPAKYRKSIAASVGTAGPGGFSRIEREQLDCDTVVQSSLNAIQSAQKPLFWKTRLCNKWEATGNCPFGIYCCFAHGNGELKKLGSQIAMEFRNVSPSNMIPTAFMRTSASTTWSGPACEKKIQCKLCLPKWKGLDKISRIYADWVDDMPLLRSSLNQVGELV